MLLGVKSENLEVLLAETEQRVASSEPIVNATEDWRDAQTFLDPTHTEVQVGRTNDEVVDDSAHMLIVPDRRETFT